VRDDDRRMADLRETSGQATIELVLLLPLIAALVLGSWQAVIVGHSWWLAGIAARAAARAQLVGGDPDRAARRALPRGARERLVLTRRGSGELTLRLAVPAVVGGLRLGSATARIGPPAGGAR